MLEQESLNFEQEASPKREFLGWNAPLLDLVTSWLLTGANREHLASSLVVVPTSNSGRRLRMALSTDGGVLSPYVITPSQLFEVDGAATRQESLWAWIQVIRQLNVEEFPHLLPNHEPGSTASFSSALAIARQLLKLRDTLADGDASFQDGYFHSPEKERWQELMGLEKEMLSCLGKWGLRDSVLAKREKAKSPDIPPGVDRIVVACVPDPTLLALQGLRSLLSAGLPVTVLIHAPETEKDVFNEWGIPDMAHWCARQIDLPEWRDRIHLSDSSTKAAEACVQVLGREETNSADTALALCDPTFSTALEKTFSDKGWPLFNPEGAGAIDSGIASTLRAMKETTGPGNSFEALLELVSQPCGESFLPDNMDRRYAVEKMEKHHQNHLPQTVDSALSLATVEEKTILDRITSNLKRIKAGPLSETLRACLVDWLECSSQETASVLEPVLVEAVEAIEKLEKQGATPQVQEVFEMMLEAIRSSKISDDRGDSVLDLQGWLEIPYDPAPHLILAGMHDECVPGGVADDLFIPDSLRTKLGLRDSRDRFARDAYLFYSATESRHQHGRVDVFVSRFNDAGEARRPSRLLMRQSGAKLAELVNHLFAESKSGDHIGGAWTRDWELDLPDLQNPYLGEKPKAISPSAIKDYLDCPLRFYLKRVVGMRVYETDKREMNAMDFGNICHRVVEAFAKDASIRDSTDEGEIYACFDELLNEAMRNSYGNDLSLPLMVQMESARERLRAFAAIQASHAADGWRIVESEYEIGEKHLSWAINGQAVRMTIDRIDRNEDGDRWCVWDYKTSGKAKKPQDTHQVTWKEDENRPLLGDLIPAQGRKKERRWADVQLPLYAAFVKEHFKTRGLPEVGYINLPRSVSEVSFTRWNDFDEQTCDHAMQWAATAVDQIRAGVFNQPAIYSSAQRTYDDFAELAPDELAAAFGL